VQAVFGPDIDRVHLASFPGDPAEPSNRGGWTGGRYDLWEPRCTPCNNNFFSVQLQAPGTTRRTRTNWGGARCLVLDDVNVKVKADAAFRRLGEPSWTFETSPGSYQCGYILTQRVDDQRVYQAVLDGLAEHGLTDPGAKKSGQYFRLPLGTNGKEKYRAHHPNGFPVRVAEWKPARTFRIEDIAQRLQVDISENALADLRLPRRSMSGVGLNARDEWIDALIELGLVQGELGNGNLGITCPWVHEHTAGDHSGTAYLGGGVFKCQHGHCDGRTSHLDRHAAAEADQGEAEGRLQSMARARRRSHAGHQGGARALPEACSRSEAFCARKSAWRPCSTGQTPSRSDPDDHGSKCGGENGGSTRGIFRAGAGQPFATCK
jgi:hypothetical protein